MIRIPHKAYVRSRNFIMCGLVGIVGEVRPLKYVLEGDMSIFLSVYYLGIMSELASLSHIPYYAVSFTTGKGWDQIDKDLKPPKFEPKQPCFFLFNFLLLFCFLKILK